MPLTTGTILESRYRIACLLGEGGYGVVYQTEDTRPGGKRMAFNENPERTGNAVSLYQLALSLDPALTDARARPRTLSKCWQQRRTCVTLSVGSAE
jgi:hypothetical protein